MTSLWRIIGLWRPEAGLLLAGTAVSLLGVAALAGVAVAAGQVAMPGALAGSVVLVWLLRGFAANRVVLRYIERLLTHVATFRALTRLRIWLFGALAARSGGGLGMLKSSEALSRLAGDVEALDGLYIRILLPAAAVAVLLPALLAVLWPIGPAVALAVAGLLLASAWLLPAMAAWRTMEAGGQTAGAAAGLRVAALDIVTGMREIRAFGAEGRLLAQLQAREAALFQAQRRLLRHAAGAGAGAFLCGQAALLAVLLAVLFAPAPSPGLALPAVLLTLVAFEVVGGMPRAGALAGLAGAAAGRIVAVADAPNPVPEPSLPLPLPQGHALRFDSVSFAWPGRAPVLDILSLEFPSGTKVAILGPSGAGKSTLAALALKVAAPQSGRVLLGGVDLARLAAADVRSRIAWIGQGTTLFEDTIRNNLLLGRPQANDAELWQALQQAGAAEVVQELPDRLDTWLGPGGTGLSGGQGRRVALARALLSHAPVLILDEPADGLDAAAERAFFEALNEAAPDRTVILIVHRLTGVERLDRIWRLSGGRAVAATG